MMMRTALRYTAGYWGLGLLLLILGLRASAHPGWNVVLLAGAGVLAAAGAAVMLATWWQLHQQAAHESLLPVDYTSLRKGVITKEATRDARDVKTEAPAGETPPTTRLNAVGKRQRAGKPKRHQPTPDTAELESSTAAQ